MAPNPRWTWRALWWSRCCWSCFRKVGAVVASILASTRTVIGYALIAALVYYSLCFVTGSVLFGDRFGIDLSQCSSRVSPRQAVFCTNEVYYNQFIGVGMFNVSTNESDYATKDFKATQTPTDLAFVLACTSSGSQASLLTRLYRKTEFSCRKAT